MPSVIYDELMASLAGEGPVSDQALRLAVAYIEHARRGSLELAEIFGLGEAMACETITEDTLNDVRCAMVRLVECGLCTTAQVPTVVYALTRLADPRLVPLLTAWLGEHLRELLVHHRAVSQLLFGLTGLGAPVPFRPSAGVSTVELNIETATKYLEAATGARPWQ
ncbi:hypothetical protein [Tahibacter amnicola]|uniref:Uncharacterized protein n=1 Tax=Tahibacter amnicola TaxID=2976241 RepID=A0ABY6BCH5_9GAMM|nr:hypothetical protein [Tahibacter amnicola]UXI67744.1 hypothetical protein N4264_23910 [Tahibacter amnicola]